MILGIDPGVNGGAALLSLNQKILQAYSFHNKSEQEIATQLGLWCELSKGCFLEKVNTRPGDGRVGAFTFGRVYGFLRGVVISNNCRIASVSPALWQTRMGCLTGGDKSVSKRAARRLFPNLKMTHYIADAVLIAEYGRRLFITNPAVFNVNNE